MRKYLLVRVAAFPSILVSEEKRKGEFFSYRAGEMSEMVRESIGLLPFSAGSFLLGVPAFGRPDRISSSAIFHRRFICEK